MLPFFHYLPHRFVTSLKSQLKGNKGREGEYCFLRHLLCRSKRAAFNRMLWIDGKMLVMSIRKWKLDTYFLSFITDALNVRVWVCVWDGRMQQMFNRLRWCISAEVLMRHVFINIQASYTAVTIKPLWQGLLFSIHV